MQIDPIKPHSDPRVTHKFAKVNGRTYHYVHALPPHQPPKATAMLLHGFPDLWFGWRYIIPHLLSLGLRLIVPDCLGYGQSSSPYCPPSPLTLYSFKSMSSDLFHLLNHIPNPPLSSSPSNPQHQKKVILISHDWGAVLATRFYYYYPSYVQALASICVPFSPPYKEDVRLEQIVEMYPNFRYQLAFAGLELEKKLVTPEQIGRFLNGMFYVRQKGQAAKPAKAKINDPEADILNAIGNLPKSSLWREGELEYYVEQFSRNGMHGPFNWYRTRNGIMYEEEKDLEINTIPIPALYIAAEYDFALPPSLGKGQEKFVTNLTRGVVKTTHWAMVEDPGSVNRILEGWLRKKVFCGNGEEGKGKQAAVKSTL